MTKRTAPTTDRTAAVDLDDLPHRYVALWNEPAAETRAELIRELWRHDGVQVLVDPPQAIRDAAANLEFPVPSLAVRGLDALEARVARA